MAQENEKVIQLEVWHPTWLTNAQRNLMGQPLSNFYNTSKALETDPCWKGVFGYNEMLRKVMVLKPIPVEAPWSHEPYDLENFKPEILEEIHVLKTLKWLQRIGLSGLVKELVYDAVYAVASANPFHPVRAYLSSLEWDGIPRLSNLLSTYFHTENTPYSRAISRMTLIALVARACEPGCKAEHMLILEGEQGIGKSTALRILASAEFFSDSLPQNIESKDAQIHVRDKWLIEMGELKQFSKTEALNLKQYLSRQVEEYRPPYGRLEIREPRQCLFIGTTNQREYLRDPTGDRRFWPIWCTKIDHTKLQQDRDQLFAEAVEAYRAGEPWHPARDFESEHIVAAQEARFEKDAWHEMIENYLKAKSFIKLDDLLALLSLPLHQRNTSHVRRVKDILHKLGFAEYRDAKKRGYKRK